MHSVCLIQVCFSLLYAAAATAREAAHWDMGGAGGSEHIAHQGWRGRQEEACIIEQRSKHFSVCRADGRGRCRCGGGRGVTGGVGDGDAESVHSGSTWRGDGEGRGRGEGARMGSGGGELDAKHRCMNKHEEDELSRCLISLHHQGAYLQQVMEQKGVSNARDKIIHLIKLSMERGAHNFASHDDEGRNKAALARKKQLGIRVRPASGVSHRP